MISVHVRKVKPEKEARLRQWFAELNARAVEVRETFRAEGVRHELAFIVSTSDGPILVWAAELDDPEAAASTFKRSKLPIDVEHSSVLRDCLGEKVNASALFDVALHIAGGSD